MRWRRAYTSPINKHCQYQHKARLRAGMAWRFLLCWRGVAGGILLRKHLHRQRRFFCYLCTTVCMASRAAAYITGKRANAALTSRYNSSSNTTCTRALFIARAPAVPPARLAAYFLHAEKAWPAVCNLAALWKKEEGAGGMGRQWRTCSPSMCVAFVISLPLV